jgi:predicted ribosome quality control (RQC) complex YloA/Tae2 family protein
MADHKEIKLPQSASYSNLPEYKNHVNQILASYDSPDGVLGELVRQMADAMWWVKTYQKDKDHLLVMKMASLVISRHAIDVDAEQKSLRVFDGLLKSWSGQVLDPDDQAVLDSAMRSKGHNMASLRSDAVRRSIKELEVIDRLIERQFKNMRLLMQSYESVRFAPQLLKKMDLEIKQLEQAIEKTIEDQRREVSRQ